MNGPSSDALQARATLGLGLLKPRSPQFARALLVSSVCRRRSAALRTSLRDCWRRPLAAAPASGSGTRAMDGVLSLPLSVRAGVDAGVPAKEDAAEAAPEGGCPEQEQRQEGARARKGKQPPAPRPTHFLAMQVRLGASSSPWRTRVMLCTGPQHLFATWRSAPCPAAAPAGRRCRSTRALSVPLTPCIRSWWATPRT